MSKLGDYIKLKREEKDLSLRDLSEISGISHSYIAKIERNDKNIHPTVETLTRLAEGLNISLNLLLEQAGYLDQTNKELVVEYQQYTESLMNIIIEDEVGNKVKFSELDPELQEDFRNQLELLLKKHIKKYGGRKNK
jgi:transcriptional regulator with XRE-family HTH domain